jgi:uncharacterized protein YycO
MNNALTLSSIKKKVTLFLCTFLFALLSNAALAKKALMDGDIIFHTSKSSQSLAIQEATGSKYSHMGIIFHRDSKPFVYEAIATVQFTPLDKWVARGSGKHYVVKRLKHADRFMTLPAQSRLRLAANQFKGIPYDLKFEWSDNRIYCSELVWKIYQRGIGIEIGKLQRIKDFDLKTAAVKTKVKERYGNKVPLDERIISPAAMFESSELITVQQQ